MTAPARLLRGLAAALLLTLGLAACATEHLPSQDTDPRAYPGSRSGESFAAVQKEFGVAVPSQATDVRFYVETTVDTRDLYLAFAASPTQVRTFLSGFVQGGTNPLDLGHAYPGCFMLCTDGMPSELPWHLDRLGDRARNLEADTKNGATVDFTFDETSPATYRVYLHAVSLGS